MRRKQHRTADAATARETRQTYEPNQWRELLKVALLASAFIGSKRRFAYALSELRRVSLCIAARVD